MKISEPYQVCSMAQETGSSPRETESLAQCIPLLLAWIRREVKKKGRGEDTTPESCF